MPKVITAKKKKEKKVHKQFTVGWVSKKEVLLFTKNLSILLKAGSTLAESIAVLRDQAKGKWRVVLSDLQNHVEKGLRFSESLEHYPKIFSPIYRGIVRIGEQSGTLEESLMYINQQLAKSYELRRKVLNSMMYPAIVFVGTATIGFAVAIFVLPKMAKLFSNFNIPLPLTTRVLLVVANFFQHYGLWTVLMFVVGTVLAVWLLRLRLVAPLTHWIILHLPVVKNVSVHLNLALFCRTLGILLRTGVTIDEGLKTCATTTPNIHYTNFLNHVHEQIKGGESLAEILKEKRQLFPLTDVQIIQVGEASGSLSDSLEYCAAIHEEEVSNITKNLATILEPIVLLFLGSMVALLALSVITPIYSITSQFRTS